MFGWAKFWIEGRVTARVDAEAEGAEVAIFAVVYRI